MAVARLERHVAPPPSLYGISLDRIDLGKRAAAHRVYKAIRRYKAELQKHGLMGEPWETPHAAECDWFIAQLRKEHATDEGFRSHYWAFATAIHRTRAALGLAHIDLPRVHRAPRPVRPSLFPEQEMALRGYSIAELRRLADDFADAAELRAWAITAGAPRTRDLDEMSYDELVREIVNRRGGVFSRAMPDVGPVKFARLYARHHCGWRPLACLRGPRIRHLMPLRAFLALEAAVNESVMNNLKLDALQGQWLHGMKPRKGGDMHIRQLIKSRPPLSIEEAIHIAFQIRALLADQAPPDKVDDLMLFRCDKTHRIRSCAEFDVDVLSWVSEPFGSFLRACARHTGVSFAGIHSMNIRVTAIRRMVAEEPTLEAAMLRTGHDTLGVLLDYLEPRQREWALDRDSRPRSDFHDALFDDAAEMFEHGQRPLCASVFRSLADRRPVPPEAS